MMDGWIRYFTHVTKVAESSLNFFQVMASVVLFKGRRRRRNRQHSQTTKEFGVRERVAPFPASAIVLPIVTPLFG